MLFVAVSLLVRRLAGGSFSTELCSFQIRVHRKFAVEEGDHLTMLNVYEAFIKVSRPPPGTLHTPTTQGDLGARIPDIRAEEWPRVPSIFLLDFLQVGWVSYLSF